ncbi:MAG: site-2 protease family protein [Anaerolineales bacterium]|jgi:Zn-dependent protease/CBS domain-containing protein
MRRHSISLGRWLGIPIELDYTWFLIFALLTWSLAVSYFPQEFSGWPAAEYWIIGAITSVLLFGSVVLHELGHSIVAQRFTVEVRRITLFIFGGVSDIKSEPPSAGAEFWIAVVGPIVSLALAGLFALLKPLVNSVEPLLALVTYLAYINVTLAAFNLIPGFPLDGGRVLRSVLWGITNNLRKATMVAANVGRFIAFGFIFFGVWQMFSGNLTGGLWIAFIGWFLESAAVSQVQQQQVSSVLEGHKVREAMNPKFASVSPDETLQEVIHEKILGTGVRSYIVENGHDPVGLITLHQVRDVPRQNWETVKAKDTMIPLADLEKIKPEESLADAVKRMDQEGVNQLPVMADDHIVGLLTRESIVTYLRNLQSLGL